MEVNVTEFRISTPKAAVIIGVTPKTLYRWRKIGYGPNWYKIGGIVRYSMADIVDWIHNREGSER